MSSSVLNEKKRQEKKDVFVFNNKIVTVMIYRIRHTVFVCSTAFRIL